MYLHTFVLTVGPRKHIYHENAMRLKSENCKVFFPFIDEKHKCNCKVDIYRGRVRAHGNRRKKNKCKSTPATNAF